MHGVARPAELCQPETLEMIVIRAAFRGKWVRGEGLLRRNWTP